MSAMATLCVDAMETTLQAMTVFANKTVFVYGQDDLIAKIQGLKVYPAVGIVYEGMRSVPSEGKSFHVGMSGELVISLLLIDQGEAIVRSDDKKTNAIMYLDTLRATLMATRSPTGHFWHFLVETPAELKKGMVIWVQRWSTPVQAKPNHP
jgi:hypothetical protein